MSNATRWFAWIWMLGRHTLQLVLGEENHVPFDPPLMSEKITITAQ